MCVIVTTTTTTATTTTAAVAAFVMGLCPVPAVHKGLHLGVEGLA